MDYVFSPATAALLNTGQFRQAVTPTGQLLPAARDAVTGQFVEIAKIFYPSTAAAREDRGVLGLLAHSVGGAPFEPLVAPIHLTVAPLQVAQTHVGFQKIYRMLNSLKINLAVMQATIPVIGMGKVSGTVLSAVNLEQIFKLRDDAKHQRLKIKDGFIDLRHSLKEKGVEVIQQIYKVAHDSKFEMHRQKLINGYDAFSKGIKRCQSALTVPELKQRNAEINNGRDLLFEALRIYENPSLLEGLCGPVQLRHMECVWAIELAICITFQLQRACDIASDRLLVLRTKIRQNCLDTLKICASEAELDFLFPELLRILGHDLPVLEFWQNEIDWMQTLSPKEQHQLAGLDKLSSETLKSSLHTTFAVLPQEPALYENLKQKSHFLSLRDQLLFAIEPDFRREYEFYISQQASASGYQAFVAPKWQEISDLTVGNLFYYFKCREDSTIAYPTEQELQIPAMNFMKVLDNGINCCELPNSDRSTNGKTARIK
ncbi:MAG: hypothetical protein ACRC62_12270 [Microcoleus sp.]